MSTPDHAVSVIVPTYNRADLLVETVDSVLSQTIGGIQLIVVDDGSTDGTQARLVEYCDPRLRYVYQENAGGPAARNRGFEESCAPYLMFLDSDDVLFPDALEALLEAAAWDPDIDVIGGRFEYADITGRRMGEYSPSRSSAELDLLHWLFDCPFIPSATLVKRESFEMVGGFDTEQDSAQDWDLWLRMAAVGCRMRAIDREICRYRLHPGGLTANIERQKSGYLRALGKHFGEGQHDPAILAVRGEAYAQAYIHIAAREYSAGLVEEAQADVRAAATSAPTWVTSGVLLERLIRKGESCVVADDPEIYASTVLASLPLGVMSRRSRKRGLARVAASRLFRRCNASDSVTSPELWWEAISNDPAWLRNLGIWSIGMQILRRELARRIRRLLPIWPLFRSS